MNRPDPKYYITDIPNGKEVCKTLIDSMKQFPKDISILEMEHLYHMMINECIYDVEQHEMNNN